MTQGRWMTCPKWSRIRTQVFHLWISFFPYNVLTASGLCKKQGAILSFPLSVFHWKICIKDWLPIKLLFLFLFCIAVPIKSELAVEILEKGQVRFWMQAEKLSGNTKVSYIFNDKEIFEGPVCFTLFRFWTYHCTICWGNPIKMQVSCYENHWVWGRRV